MIWIAISLFIGTILGFFLAAALSRPKVEAAEELFNGLEWRVRSTPELLDEPDFECYNRWKGTFR